MTLTTQFTTLLAMAATGLGMAWAFDLYTWSRAKLRLRKILTFLFDMTYWIAFALSVLIVLYNVNQGKLRIPIFFAILLGGIVYFQLLSRPFLHIWDRLVALIIRIVKFILRLLKLLIYQPIAWMLATVFSILLAIGTGLWKVLRTMFRWLSRPFIAFYRKLAQLAIALAHKIGKMIVQLVRRKPKDE